MTEIDFDDKELFVPFSEIGGEEPDKPDASRGAVGRLYNDFPSTVRTSITILRRSGGIMRSVSTLDQGATSVDYWATDQLYLSMNTGFKDHIYGMTGKGGFSYRYRVYLSLPAGTTNIARLFGLSSSATDGAEVEQAR
ncbi:hypothetical protein ABZ894_02660 [Nocardia beijingensis]|uniref:hypothetical protein n=1 Tax=Nocardia beijingensis TaxID=95162 RepID=UPI0033FD06C5